MLANHLRDARRDRLVLVVALLALSGVAWLALAAWSGSPGGAHLGHEPIAGTPPLLGLALFTAGWVLMIVAMMLPSSIPLVVVFAGLVRRRPRPRRLVALLLAGYLTAWAAVGLVAWIADRAIHLAVDGVPWLGAHPQVILAATLALAGLWQLSPLRDRCLDACRTPLGFVVARWRGTSPARESLAMGIAHGMFCVGCCWSLMLVMFGVGLGSLPAMLGLGVLTAIEKNAAWGRRLGRPIAVGLVVAGVYVLAA
jgi:predicted metal-binding membrane protein